MGKKIACVLTELFEDSKYTKPAQACTDGGREVVTSEKEQGKKETAKKAKTTVTIDKSTDDVNRAYLDPLFIPGDFSPDKLRADDRFVTFTKHFMDEHKPVFAICHGPQLLITAKTLEGRKATGYKSIQVDMEYAGAEVSDEEVVVCQNQLVTSRQPDDLPAFNRESLKTLQE